MAEKDIIRQITVVNQQGTSICVLGFNGVERIVNNTFESESGTDYQYDAYDKNGKLLRQIINCPVDIEYQ